MTKTIPNAQIEWNSSGMPVATQFDDVYFSNQDGLAETRYVFLGQNNLPSRWNSHPDEEFVIAESGFGSGLNFLASWQAFDQFSKIDTTSRLKTLKFISFEKYPMSQANLARTLAHWPELKSFSQQLTQCYPLAYQQGCHQFTFAQGQVVLELWFGDIIDSIKQLPRSNGRIVDCWYLDGFAPSKNPEMWTQTLFDQMAELGRQDATLATFTAAGFVRRGLQDAGFTIKKVKGYGTKREMLIGRLIK